MEQRSARRSDMAETVGSNPTGSTGSLWQSWPGYSHDPCWLCCNGSMINCESVGTGSSHMSRYYHKSCFNKYLYHIFLVLCQALLGNVDQVVDQENRPEHIPGDVGSTPTGATGSIMGVSSNGKTVGLHPANEGSTPSTVHCR